MKINRINNIVSMIGFAASAAIFSARAAAPLVDTPIGNQAKATYTDDSGVAREVFSNTVITKVTQIYALDLQQDNTRIATPGSQVYFPHTVTNLGNGPDTISLTAADTGTVSLTGLAIYPDANQDGLPDNFITITTTGSLAAGGSFHFVVSGIVPPSATATQTGGVTVVANSSDILNTPTATDTNNDSFTVTNDAVLQVNKSISVSSGLPGLTPVKYTITYTNTGNSAATNVTISDLIPTGMTYVANSARWSVIPSTTLTDADKTDNQTGIIYDENVTTPGAATYVIANVGVGQSGFVTFEVSVNTGIPPQVIPNTAQYSFTSGGAKGPFNSNTVPFTVIQVPGVTLTPPTDIPTANAGDTVSWTNVLVNTGTGTDTFDITITGNTFPVGTTFQIFQADASTPMVDSNGNGIPDTGPVAAGATYNVIMKAVLPGSANGNNGGAGFTVTKLATSTFDPGTKDDAIDKLVTIAGAGVDLTNNTVGGLGVGLNSGDNNVSIIVNNPTNPGTITTFTLVVKNTGPNPDTFNLLADKDGAFGSVNDLPAGWTVTFKDSGGTVVSNTGVIASLANKTFTAAIFVPAGSLPSTKDIYFQSKSPVTAAGDIIHDAVAVNTVRNISIQTDNVGQTFPGGAVVYEHLLTNNGNVTEGTNGGGGTSALTLTHIDNLSAGGFSSVIYYDADGNGALTASDPVLVSGLAVVKPAGLAPGEQIRLFVKTFAPLGAADGAVNVTTVTVTTTGVINLIAAPAVVVNTDTTSVIRGDLAILKEQAIDTNKNGVIDALELPFVTTQLSAPPGAVIIYKITVTNSGSANATGITVNDSVPANTTYFATGSQGVAGISGSGTVNSVDASPANGGVGAFLFNVGTLAPTQSSTMTFGAQINQ
jgi:trimeric autotransporter adhesin